MLSKTWARAWRNRTRRTGVRERRWQKVTGHRQERRATRCAISACEEWDAFLAPPTAHQRFGVADVV